MSFIHYFVKNTKAQFIKLFLFLFLIADLHAYDRVTGHHFASRSEIFAQNGMAATSQPLATQAALQILQQGGNAVDAAIAANAVLGLVEPTGCGIGGDLYALVWNESEATLHGLNASGRSPKGLTLDYFKKEELDRIPKYGPLPVSVPGAVDGWFELHDKFGKLSMQKILAPAIYYAKQGFPLSELVAYYLDLSVDRIGDYPGFRETFMPDGQTPRKGEVFKNPNLAEVYETLAKKGRKGFYQGEIASVIAKTVRQQGGFLSKRDLMEHTSTWVEPLSTNYRGYTLWELPPNGQGIAALQILNILEAYPLDTLNPFHPDYIHRFVEAKKLVFEDRAKFYSDPDFNDIPVAELISKSYADKRRKLIDEQRASKRLDAGNPALLYGDTIYLTTADKDGNMVSLIQSNYRGMGSGVIPEGLGFVLQNRGELFSLQPGHFNVYEPAKRPFHTIIPAFVTKDGEPWMSFGVMGGAVQPQMHAQVLINIIDFGMNLQEAGDAPRFIHSGSSQPTGEVMDDGGFISMEEGFPAAVRRELMRRGHVLRQANGWFGGYQAIGYDTETGVYAGASESRKDGQAAGY